MDLSSTLAITLLGLAISGRVLLVVAIVVLAIVAAAWLMQSQRSR